MKNITIESENENSSSSKILLNNKSKIDHKNDNKCELIIKKERINDVRFLNKYFEEINKN